MNIESIANVAKEVFLNQNTHLEFKDIYDEIHITPSTAHIPKGAKKGHFDGLVMVYYKETKDFEVFEYGAGNDQNELRVYTETRYLKTALKSLLKGRFNRKAIKVY